MKPAHVLVPLAALAALLTRWPALVPGIASTLLAGMWVASVWIPGRPRVQVTAPVWAVAMLLVPVAADPLVPLPAFVVGALVAAGIVAMLPERLGRSSVRPSAWLPAILVAALLLLPALVTTFVGPARLTAIADRFSPAGIAVAALVVAAATLGFHLIAHREVQA